MKIVSIILLLLCVAFASTYDCEEGCLGCEKERGCKDGCYNARLVPPTPRPLTLHDLMNPSEISDKYRCVPLDQDDNCVEYQIRYNVGVTCVSCKKGLAYNPKTQSCDTPSIIPNCYVEIKDYDRHKCHYCEGGCPDGWLWSCIPFEDTRINDPNCWLGSSNDGNKHCFDCKDGYSKINGLCQKTPPEYEGCSDVAGGGGCWKCDKRNGWFSREAYVNDNFKKCVKSKNILQSLPN